MTCVNCDGSHRYADCPALPPKTPTETRCSACGGAVNPITAECLGCSN